MPMTCPSLRRSPAVINAAIDALAASRLIGTMPIAGNRNLVALLFMYSALPRKITGRGGIDMTSGVSKNDRWLGLRITGPVDGTLWRPLTCAQ